MKCSDYTDAQIVDALRRCGGNKAKAAKSLGVSTTTLKDRIDRIGAVTTDIKPEKPAWKSDQQSESWVIEAYGDRIESVDDALKAAGVDAAIWEVERVVVNGWDVTMKVRAGAEDKALTKQNRQIKVWLRRKVARGIEIASADLMKRMEKYSPKYTEIKHKKDGEFLLEVSPYDLHFGSLAWGEETGNDYDCAIAERIFVDAVERILGRIDNYKISEIVVPVGQDFFHVDYIRANTVHGTIMEDQDTRYGKMFYSGVMAFVRVIDRLRQIAPVVLKWTPGNHDRTTSYHLAVVLSVWYRTAKDVTVDVSPKVRKYHRFGVNLLGFTHGEEENHRDLPTIMAAEMPTDWAETTSREWHVGHFHKMKQTVYNAGDTHVGIKVRVLPSLSGTDYWHYLKGYVNKNRALEAYLWHKTDGYFGHFAVNASNQ